MLRSALYRMNTILFRFVVAGSAMLLCSFCPSHSGAWTQRTIVEESTSLMDIVPRNLTLTKDSTSWLIAKVKVLNRGGSDLHLGEVTSSCGCASATIMKNPIHPMEVGEVLIRINTTAILDSVSVIEYRFNSDATNAPYVYKVIVKDIAKDSVKDSMHSKSDVKK